MKERSLRTSIYMSALFVTSFVPFVLLADPPPKIVNISVQKLESEVNEALKHGRAEIASFGTCQNECSSDRESSEPEVDYDKNEIPYIYKLPTAREGTWVAALSTATSNTKLFSRYYFILPVSDCSDFWKKIRADQKSVTVGTPPYQLSVKYGLVKLGPNEIDLTKPYCRKMEDLGQREIRGFHIQSIVGPVVNIVNTVADRSEGWTHESFSVDWISWNLKDNRTAELTDLFDKDSVLNALKADKVMQQRFFKGRRRELKQATELTPLMRAIETDHRQGGHRMGWQVLVYDHTKHEATVHFGFYGDCCNKTKIFKMGLVLKVRPDFQDVFDSSQANGLLALAGEHWNPAESQQPEFQKKFYSLAE